MFNLLLRVALAISLLPREGLSEKTELRILGLLPYYQGATNWGSGYLLNPAPSIAVDDINNNDTILSNYKLTMTVRNGGCDDPAIVATSVGEVLLTENIVGIIGAPCSRNTIIMANIVDNLGINQISYSAEFADVSDTTEYPYFFRTTINLAHAADGFAALLGVFQRTSIIVIAEIDTWEDVATNFFQPRFRFQKQGNRVVHQSLMSNNDDDQSMDSKLRVIEQFNRHVIVTFLSPHIATRLMCRAYRLGMTYPNYLWIHHLTTGEWEWWKNDALLQGGCTAGEMQLAHNGSLIHRLQYTPTNKTRYDQFIDKYKVRLEQYLSDLNVPFIPSDSNCSDTSLPCVNSIVHGLYSHTAYDAVWVLATALDRAEKILNESYGLNLGNFERGVNNFSKVIHDSLELTNYAGLSGTIKFELGDNRTLNKNTRAIISGFYQINLDGIASIATYDANLPESQRIIEMDNRLQFVNSSIPPDVDSRYQLLFFPEVVYILLILNIIFLATTLVLLVLNTVCAYHQPFKGSDATLTDFQTGALLLLTMGTLVGCIFGSANIDNSLAFSIAVNSSIWMTEVGLLVFLSIAVLKSYRFYSIFVGYLSSRRTMNVKLIIGVTMAVVAVLSLYELVLTIVWPYMRSPDRFCDFAAGGDLIRCFYYNIDVANVRKFVSYVVIVVTVCICGVLFIMGFQGWAIKDPRFYDIHSNAMLGVGVFFYCVLVAVTTLTSPHLHWPFLHALSMTVACGIVLQIFFVAPLLWRFFTLHRSNARTKCHCKYKTRVSLFSVDSDL